MAVGSRPAVDVAFPVKPPLARTKRQGQGLYLTRRHAVVLGLFNKSSIYANLFINATKYPYVAMDQ
jgi:hypothetical protein